MDDVISQLELVVSNMEKRIDTLSWKIKKFQSVYFSENDSSNTCKMMSLLNKVAKTCQTYDEILVLVEQHRKEENEYTDALQVQINLAKSKVDTLMALVNKENSIE